jgi:hypothetical protein
MLSLPNFPINCTSTILHTLYPPSKTVTEISYNMSQGADAAHAHSELFTSLERAADKYPKPEKLVYSYGTAGFRTL